MCFFRTSHVHGKSAAVFREPRMTVIIAPPIVASVISSSPIGSAMRVIDPQLTNKLVELPACKIKYQKRDVETSAATDKPTIFRRSLILHVIIEVWELF